MHDLPWLLIMTGIPERIDKFFVDCKRWTGENIKNDSKVLEEMNKLHNWIDKHQTEMCSEEQQEKLLEILELFYRYSPRNTSTSSVSDKKLELLQDFLNLPIGFLLTHQGKEKIIQWVESIVTLATNPETVSCSTTDATVESRLWLVADIEGFLLRLETTMKSLFVLNVNFYLRLSSYAYAV